MTTLHSKMCFRTDHPAYTSGTGTTTTTAIETYETVGSPLPYRGAVIAPTTITPQPSQNVANMLYHPMDGYGKLLLIESFRKLMNDS